MDWAHILAYVTGMVDQELLARNEYLAAENRILKSQLNGRLRLSDAERATLGEIGHRLGRKVLGEVANVALSFPKIISAVAMMQSGQDWCDDNGPRSLDGSS
jgi:hypothetical protein